MSPQQQLDQRALEIATRASEALAAHERLCAERLEAIRGHLGRLESKTEDGFRALHGRTWTFVATVIAFETAAIGWFLATYGL